MRLIGEHDPFVRMAGRRTVLALAATPKTAERLQVLGCARVEMEACVGMTASDCEAIARLANTKAAGTFRAISIGNLVCWKGFDLKIAAFAHFASKRLQAEYWIFGDGPERQRLEAMASRLGIKNSVRFSARVPRGEVLSRLAQCDVLIHPSSHDSGPRVSLEAMAAGLPVVCLDLGGITAQVNADAGFRLTASDRDLAIRQIAEALSELAENSHLKQRLGQAGQARVKAQFNWNDKGTQLARRYQEVTSVTRPKPDPVFYRAHT